MRVLLFALCSGLCALNIYFFAVDKTPLNLASAVFVGLVLCGWR